MAGSVIGDVPMRESGIGFGFGAAKRGWRLADSASELVVRRILDFHYHLSPNSSLSWNGSWTQRSQQYSNPYPAIHGQIPPRTSHHSLTPRASNHPDGRC